MIAIKLRPVGKKKQISYRVVVMEKKSKLKGKFIEDLGWYNPHTNKFLVRADRVEFWIKNGAQPTDTVHNILVKGKIQEGKKIPKHKVVKQAPVSEAPIEPKKQEEPVAPAPETATAEKEAPSEEESTKESSTEEASAQA